MNSQNREKMADLSGLNPANPIGQLKNVAYPIETRMDKGFQGELVTISKKQVADPTRPIIAEFVTPAKAAELTDWSLTTVKRHCRDGKFKDARKTMIEGIESWQIPVSSLPPEARAKLATEFKTAIVARAAASTPPAPVVQSNHAAIEVRAMWDAYERSGTINKKRAEKAFAAVRMFHDLVEQGSSKGDAEKAVFTSYGASKPTLWRYRNATDGHHQSEWLPRLSPKYKGGRPPAEITDAALYDILSHYFTTSKQPFAVIMENARIKGRQNGWLIPSNDAVLNQIKKLPDWVSKQGREGPKALERNHPAVKRNYTTLALNELWESDGRSSDIWCLWPDGTTARPFLIVWRDVRSRFVLGVKGCLNPNTEVALSALFMAMERTGTAPDFAKLDNGREYASKAMTGGQKTRYRFDVVPGEQIGVLTHLGVKVEWSEPGRGQDKPIESWWNYGANRIDKAPEFEGAYCGRNATSKPENFDRKKAIPIAVFEAKVNEVYQRYNTEHRHSGDGMNGRTPLEVYTELAAETTRHKVNPAHLRMCKQGATQLTPGQGNIYTLKIPGYGECRYHCADIANLSSDVLSRKHNVYFYLEDPKSPISVYDGDVFLGDAVWRETLPFRGAGLAAAEHKKNKTKVTKDQKEFVKQIKAKTTVNPHITATITGPMEIPPMGLSFEDKRKPPMAPVLVDDDPWEDTGKPGESRNRETGEIIQNGLIAAIAGAITVNPPIHGNNAQQWQHREKRA